MKFVKQESCLLLYVTLIPCDQRVQFKAADIGNTLTDTIILDIIMMSLDKV